VTAAPRLLRRRGCARSRARRSAPRGTDPAGTVAHTMIAIRLSAALVLALAATAAAADGRAHLEAFLEQARTWRAGFEQTISDGAGRVLEVAEGEVRVARPGRFRWDYRSPYEQSIIADGATLWIHDRDLEQVTRRPLDEGLDATPAALLGGEIDLDARYVVRAHESDDALSWVELRPRGEDEQYAAIRIGFDGEALVAMEIEDNLGQYTVLHFTDAERNAAIDESVFRFTPPPGVDVIGAAGAGSGP